MGAPKTGGGVKKAYKWNEKNDLLGSGNFADVYRAQRDTSVKRIYKDYADNEVDIPQMVAVKVIDKSKAEDMEDVRREIDVMTRLNHPNILKLFEVDDEPKKVFLVMELVTGGELFDRVIAKEKYTEREAADTIVTLCSALAHLHAQKPPIVHRDLKPENILYGSPADDAPIKLADFGLARFVEPGAMMTTACGTPGYVAPEILKNEGYDSPAVDMWSVGVVLYILLCGFPPFYEEELPKLFEQIMHAQYDFPSPWWDMITAEGKQLVQELLVIDPKKRLTAEQVIAHPFMKKATDRVLQDAQKTLKKYQANRKLRKAALGIIAQRRLEGALAELRRGAGSK